MIEISLYPRKCNCCGKGMGKGYHDCGQTYCSDRCLIWGNSEDGLNSKDEAQPIKYDMNDWESECRKYPDDCYYTEWEEVDEDEYYDSEGNRYSHCEKCNDFTMDMMDYCHECLTHK